MNVRVEPAEKFCFRTFPPLFRSEAHWRERLSSVGGFVGGRRERWRGAAAEGKARLLKEPPDRRGAAETTFMGLLYITAIH